MNDAVSHGKLEIHADVRVEAYDINVLDSLVLARLLMAAHVLVSTPVQRVLCLQGTLFHYGMGT